MGIIDDLLNNTDLMDSNNFTPQSIAWKLIMDDIDTSMVSTMLVYDPENMRDEDPVTYIFELLITIFMELIFNIALISEADAIEKNENDKEFKFNPDLKKFDMESCMHVLEEKFKMLGIFVHVDTYEKNEYNKDMLKEIVDGRYCRVVLRHQKDDLVHFIKNNVPDDVNYHMILNAFFTSKRSNKLRDVYAIILLNDKVYQIYFNQ